MGRRMEAGILLDLHSWVFERVRDKLEGGVCVTRDPCSSPSPISGQPVTCPLSLGLLMSLPCVLLPPTNSVVAPCPPPPTGPPHGTGRRLPPEPGTAGTSVFSS